MYDGYRVMMNMLNVKAEHKVFLTYKFEEFSFFYQNVEIEIFKCSQMIEITLHGRKNIKKLYEIFYVVYDMLFLVLGGYPKIKEIYFNSEIVDFSEWSNKFDTSSHFVQRDLRIANITIQNINANSLTNLQKVHSRSLFSMQYLACKKYEPVVTDHKYVLLSHTIDGLVRHSDYEKILLKSAKANNVKSKNSRVEYRQRVELVFNKFFYYHRKYNCGIMKALGKNKGEFIDVISDTRNDFSHFLDKKEKRLHSGSDMIHYFYIMLFALRLFILTDLLGIELEHDCVKEYLYSLHDWIRLKKNENFTDFKSIAYLQYQRGKESKEIFDRIRINKPY